MAHFGLFQVDLSLYKNIRLGRRLSAQLRFEVFNVFDRVQFLNVNDALNPTVVLDAPLASASRILSSEPLLAFGQATKSRDPRQAQFGVKLIF